MRGLRWMVVPLVALVVGCGENGPSDYPWLTGVYRYSVAVDGWGPAISLPSGEFEIHKATPDSLVLRWVNPPASDPNAFDVARFVNGAYQLRVVDSVWTVDLHFQLDGEDLQCEAALTPSIAESPIYCLLDRLGDLQVPPARAWAEENSAS